MAAQEEEEEIHQFQQPQNLHHHFSDLLSSYLGLSFSLFLGFLPQNAIPLLPSLQNENEALAVKLAQAEDQLHELHSRRKEDFKANARVVEIFASHRHAWQQAEKRLLQQIDDCNDEIAYLKAKLEDFDGVEAEFKASIEDLKREISERDEMLNFMSRSNCDMENEAGECYGDVGVTYGKTGVSEDCYSGEELGSVYGQSNTRFNPEFLNSAASKFWSEKASPWQVPFL